MNNKKSQIEKLLFVITLIFDIGPHPYLLIGLKGRNTPTFLMGYRAWLVAEIA